MISNGVAYLVDECDVSSVYGDFIQYTLSCDSDVLSDFAPRGFRSLQLAQVFGSKKPPSSSPLMHVRVL